MLPILVVSIALILLFRGLDILIENKKTNNGFYLYRRNIRAWI